MHMKLYISKYKLIAILVVILMVFNHYKPVKYYKPYKDRIPKS